MDKNQILIQTPDYLILLNPSNNQIIGVISLFKKDDFYYVGGVAAEKGYGTIMYKLAMSHIHPAMLMSDRDSHTSDSALNVIRKLHALNLSTKTLKRTNPNYNFDPSRTEEENTLLNTQYKYKKDDTYQTLFNDGLEYLKTQPKETLKELNRNASNYFFEKLMD